ncbi:MAG TPA: hypothetical protein DEP00_06195 [Lachnospiraceae bacterium]|jgi:uncharacterized membrane protein|nr:hypothetical protein [Lachnospiraceae bacterium]
MNEAGLLAVIMIAALIIRAMYRRTSSYYIERGFKGTVFAMKAVKTVTDILAFAVMFCIALSFLTVQAV